MSTTTKRYRMIPASQLRPGQPRIRCCPTSYLAERVRKTGRLSSEFSDCHLVAGDDLADYEYTHAIVEDVEPETPDINSEMRRMSSPPIGTRRHVTYIGEDLGTSPPTVIAVPVAPRPTKPTKPHPTDEEIVAAYALLMQWREHPAASRGGHPIGVEYGRYGVIEAILIGPKASEVKVTIADVRAAWSRVLAAKVRASDAARVEADRRMVLGPIDDAEVP